MKEIIIAIDGPASSGKSTLAKQLSRALNYDYVDSGAYYRAITLYFLENNVDIKNEESIPDALQKVSVNYLYDRGNDKPQTLLNGKNVEPEIRSMMISGEVSEVSTITIVRRWVVDQLRKKGAARGIVMDGRDIGTVVFPSAELKIFLVADASQRTHRRLLELQNSHADVSKEKIRENIFKRDQQDMQRSNAPLKKAEDAVEIDNSNLTTGQQFEMVLQLAKEKIGA